MKIRRKRHLEMILSKLDLPSKPGLEWEEYPLDPRSAAHMVYIAGWVNDVVGKRIVDLGCGSGILAISASLFGAE